MAGELNPEERKAAEERLAAIQRLKEIQQLKAGMQSEVAEPVEPQGPTLTQQAKHVAKGYGKLGLETMDMPYNVASLEKKGLEWLGDKIGVDGLEKALPDFMVPPQPSSFIPDKWKDAIAGEEFERHEAPIADTLRTGVEWGGAGPFNLVRKATVRPDIYAGVGAMIGEAITGGEGGELTGGLAGTIAGLRRGKIKGLDEDATRAAEITSRIIDDPDGVLRATKESLAEGRKGTLGDLSQNQQAMDLEGSLKVDPRFQRQADAVEATRQAQVAEDVRAPFGQASADSAADYAANKVAGRQRQISRAEASMADAAQADAAARRGPLLQSVERARGEAASATEAAMRAQDAADDAAGRMATNARPADTSTDLYRAYEKGETDFRKASERPLWKKFEKATIDTGPIREAVGDWYKGLTGPSRDAFNRKYGRLFNPFKKHKTMTGLDVQESLEDAKDIIRRLEGQGPLPKQARKLKEMVDTIEGALEESNDLYSKAKASTTEKYERFKPGKVGKARRASEPETFVKTLGMGDESGAVTARLIEQAQDPALQPKVIEHLKAVGQRQGIDDAFMRQYEDVFRRLPDSVRDDFTRVVRSGDELATSSKAADRAGQNAILAENKALQGEAKIFRETAAAERKIAAKGKQANTALNRTVMANYANKPEATVKKLLNSPDNTAQLRRLKNQLDAAGEGAAFKGHVRDILTEKLLRNPAGATRANAKSLGDFRKMRDSLVDSGIIDEIDAGQMEVALARNADSLEMREKAVRSFLNMKPTSPEKLAASGVAAVLVGSGGSGGHALIWAGAVRRAVGSYFAKRKMTPEVLKKLEDFVINPESYVAAAEKAATQKQAQMAVLTRLVGASQAAEILNEENE